MLSNEQQAPAPPPVPTDAKAVVCAVNLLKKAGYTVIGPPFSPYPVDLPPSTEQSFSRPLPPPIIQSVIKPKSDGGYEIIEKTEVRRPLGPPIRASYPISHPETEIQRLRATDCVIEQNENLIDTLVRTNERLMALCEKLAGCPHQTSLAEDLAKAQQMERELRLEELKLKQAQEQQERKHHPHGK